jgi:hypothetical protein
LLLIQEMKSCGVQLSNTRTPLKKWFQSQNDEYCLFLFLFKKDKYG